MFCDLTKEFLSLHAVAFEERDIATDPAALDQLRKLRLMTTPVTLVGDAVIVGFDESKLRQALGIGG